MIHEKVNNGYFFSIQAVLRVPQEFREKKSQENKMWDIFRILNYIWIYKPMKFYVLLCI